MCCLIHPTHRKSAFFNTADVKFIQTLVWIMCTYSTIMNLGSIQARILKYGWKQALFKYGNSIEYIFLTTKRNELEHMSHCILHVLSDHRNVPSSTYIR